MVVGITSNKDSLRVLTERYFSGQLMDLGYNAVVAYDEFGPDGLKDLTEEATYISLCNKGIDAVITMAWIDQFKDEKNHAHGSFSNPNIYYYKRIWNYSNLQPDSIPGTNNITGYFWEAILFNLRTLEAECMMHSELLYTIADNKMIEDLEKRIIKKMIREGILKKQKTNNLNGF